MAMATPCCYGNFYLQKNFISYSMRGYESIFWLMWCFLVFHVLTGKVSSPYKTGSSHLKSNWTKVSRNLQDEGLEVRFTKLSRWLIGASKRFSESDNCIRGLNGLNLKLFGQNFSRPIRFVFVGPTKTSPGYIRLNTINNFVVCSCFFLYDGKNRGL